MQKVADFFKIKICEDRTLISITLVVVVMSLIQQYVSNIQVINKLKLNRSFNSINLQRKSSHMQLQSTDSSKLYCLNK